MPPASAANSSGNITRYQPSTERLDLNVLLVSTILLYVTTNTKYYHQHQIMPLRNAANSFGNITGQWTLTLTNKHKYQQMLPANKRW